ncbi:MAG: carbohydrate esterase [Bacteroidales bacterium]|nr:carbohydrate esterase [Bacteroidales bacterium]
MKFRFLLALLPLAAACAQDPVTYFPAKGASGVNPDTHLVLTFPETPVLGQSGFIRIFDAVSGECVDSLDLSLPSGLTQSRQYGPECDYTKVPYDYSRDFVPTNKNTLPGTPSGTAEPTPRDMQLTIIGGFTDGFRFHPVIIHDKVATIYPHNNLLEYGHSYYVTIDPEVLACGDFAGVKAGAWKFSTRPSGPADARHLTVAADGSGDFNTVQGALDAVPDFCKDTTWITVAAGDYEEIVYARNKTNVVIRGSGMDATKVHYANNEVFNPHPLLVKTNEWPGTFPSRRAAFALDNCDDIVLEDICIATDLTGQAEGLLLHGERIALYRVRIIGSGDALQANGTVYMQDSELIGDGDTILGRGSLFAWHSKFYNHGGPFSWVRNVKPAHGDVFVECHFEGLPDRPADFGRTNTNHGTAYPDAEFVVIDCTTRHFNPQGWSSIGEKSATMLEFRTRDADTGAPVDVSRRHKYSRQLDAVRDAALIEKYKNPAYVLAGWNPKQQ